MILLFLGGFTGCRTYNIDKFEEEVQSSIEPASEHSSGEPSEDENIDTSTDREDFEQYIGAGSCWVVAFNPENSYCFEPYQRWSIDFESHCNSLSYEGVEYMQFRDKECNRYTYVGRCIFDANTENPDYPEEATGYYYPNFPAGHLQGACENAYGVFVSN